VKDREDGVKLEMLGENEALKEPRDDGMMKYKF
jgi:hypothetical protein